MVSFAESSDVYIWCVAEPGRFVTIDEPFDAQLGSMQESKHD